MAQIEFIDQTLRDGQQSLWGMRMRAYQTTPILPNLNRTGFRVVDLTGGTLFVVMLRESGDDPWAALDHIVAGLPDTGHRAGMRPVAVGSFGFVPDSMLDLWVGTLVKHGIQTHWLFDCLYDMPLMEAKAQAIQRVGGEVVPAIMYGLTDLHTDEFFADRAREMAGWEGVNTIYVEDAPGVLTPERASTLLPALQEATPGVRLELHCHNTTGLAPLNYVEGIKAGIEIFHTCSLPMANGPSLPSTEAMVEIVEELGHSHDLDKSQLPPVAEHFAREAKRLGWATGVPNEYRMMPYRHQLPGGMTGTLINQLNEYGMPEKFPEVVDEIVRVREELGQPIMATPFSQFVGIQAVLNVVLDERYKVVPEEVLHYALGHYGPLMRPIDPEIADRIFSQPRVKDLENWERDQTTLEEFHQKLGQDLSDEELLLRYLAPEEHVDRMLTNGPLRTEPP
ncbi:MAG: oxaloacetate decarboxylase (Na+ extruding) subunit alpha, partial [Solirubrobacterales bacterium]|nr:oxaloacetate decarboxylase (Na+ extruding) subunit alpha [Solirubrobacterales bacterium]